MWHIILSYIVKKNPKLKGISLISMCNVRNTMWPVSTPSKHETLTQCWSNSDPLQTSTGSIPRVCWTVGLAVHTAGGEYKPTPTQYLFIVGPASLVLANIHSALVSTSCWRYPPSVTLAHIQHWAKQNTVTQYWAYVGSAS